MLTPEQAKAVKKQMTEHIEKGFPPEKQEFAKQQILAMNPEQLEEFLKRSNIKVAGLDTQSHQTSQHTKSAQQQCVFCSIVSNQVDSYKIGENKKAVAVLEINPLSKGHVIIIPNEHISSSDKIPSLAFSLAKEVGKRIKAKLKAKKVEISSSNLFGHEIINVIPFYKKEAPTERDHAKPEELLELQKILFKTKKIKTFKTEKKTRKLKKKKTASKKPGEKIWLPRRIP